MSRLQQYGIAPRLAALILISALSACAGGAPAGPTPALSVEGAAATITAADMAREIGVLAHDSMAGRDTPSPELEAAAAYLAGRFRSMGLEPAGEDGTFIQRYDYTVSRLIDSETVVRVEGGEAEPRYEHDFFMVSGSSPANAEAFYVGVAGSAPTPPEEARGKILVYDHPGGPMNEQWQMNVIAAIRPAMGMGSPAVIIILDPEFPGQILSQVASATAAQRAPLSIVGITDEAARQLMGDAGVDLEALRAAGEPSPLGDAVFTIRSVRSEENHTPPNVVARLSGSDPTLESSHVVLTAHFDHVGVGLADESGDSIYNGADDDASGTAAVVEIAEALAMLDPAPARSVLFLLVSGEEKGLLGSRAWVGDPTVDLEGVVANINLDMIGRNAPDTVVGIGQEYTTLQGVLQEITDAHPDLGLNVILNPVPEERWFFRSDQLPFIQKWIPAVFFTTGDHEDYHKQSDEPETIDNDKAARVARLGFYLVHAIATSPEKPEWTEDGRSQVEQMLNASPF